MVLPPFAPITDEQRRRNLAATETSVAAYMIFGPDGLSTGAYYPHWYGGYLCPPPRRNP